MSHNSRCGEAKSSNCRCSCGGSLHGGGGGGYSRSSFSSSQISNQILTQEETHNESLDERVESKIENYVEKIGIDKLKGIIKTIDPTVGTVVNVADYIYKNREELILAYSKIESTWNSDQSLEDKITETAQTMVKTTGKLIKKKVVETVISVASQTISKEAVNSLEKKKIFENIDSSLKIPGAGEHFRNLLQDSIKKETENSLSRIVEGLIE